MEMLDIIHWQDAHHVPVQAVCVENHYQPKLHECPMDVDLAVCGVVQGMGGVELECCPFNDHN